MKKQIVNLMISGLFAASLQAATLYVDVNGINPVPPYISWGTAATDIQTAVDVAVSGDKILVADGTYLLTSEVSVSVAIDIESANGPDLAIIDAGGTNRCFYLASVDCTVSGFTITNGFAPGLSPYNVGGGIYCESYVPVISNCLFSGNMAYVGGGIFKGVVYNSTFTGNTADFGGGAGGSTVNNCIFTANIANGDSSGNENGNGGGMIQGIANNSTFTGNSADGEYGNGGGMGGGTANNCVFISNSANGSPTNGVFGNGGGMFNGTANNCTFVSNSANGDGGGMYSGEINNSIAWFNTALNNGDNLDSVTARYSCSPAVSNGVDGNITSLPLFKDRSNGDLHLRATSPCIDIGNNTLVAGGFDRDGVLRIVNGIVDMGAYESVTIHYVDINSINPISPYASMETAATDIQAAVNVVEENHTVIINDGVYYPSAAITVTDNISIKSVNGPYETVVDGSGFHRVFNLDTNICTITGLTIRNGYASGGSYIDSVGGGIYCSNKLTSVSYSIFNGNFASKDGGALYMGIADNCLFVDNQATDNGGAIYSGKINNCTLSDNSAFFGGGIYEGNADNSIVWYNTAGGSGNDFYSVVATNSCSPDVTLIDGNITDEPVFKDRQNGDFRLQKGSPCIDVGNNGLVTGAVDLDGVLRIVNGVVDMGAFEFVINHYVDNNGTNPVSPYASWGTAATNIQSAVDSALIGDTVIITNGTYYPSVEILVSNAIFITSVNGADSTFIDGSGTHRVFNLASSASVLFDLTITNGYASGTSYIDKRGGGIYCVDATPVVSNCVFTGNIAVDNGGGIYYGTVKECTFENNEARLGGGMSDGVASNCVFIGNVASYEGGGTFGGTIYNSFFVGNSALAYGGGSFNSIINNSVLTDNKAGQDGGGMHSGTANNCTLTANSAKWAGGGMYAVDANNCIAWYNTAGNDGDNLYFGSANYTCSPAVENGVNGNITNEPVFASSSHIAINSPCAGAGSEVYSSGVDINGELWNNPPSMGCDEPGAVLSGDIDLRLFVPERISVGSEIFVRSTILGAVSLFTLDFGDGVMVSNQLQTLHIWNVTGEYAVVLSAFNNENPGGVFITQLVDVVESSQYVAVTGDDANDGWSEITAKRTIQAGVDAVGVGGNINVAGGTYYPAAEIVVTKDIVILGDSGTNATIINGGGTRRSFNLGSSACMLSGFTITNSYSSGNGGGIYCDNKIPVISNCVFAGNISDAGGGGIYYGTVNNSIFSGNTGKNGGGMSYSIAADCYLINNSAEFGNGGGMYYGTINKSIFENNNATYNGGGMYNGVANSSTFIKNSADKTGGGKSEGIANGCSFTGNSSSDGGGMRLGIANNCTFVGNQADNNGGGIHFVTANNCIVWYNQAFHTGDDIYGSVAHYSSSPDVIDGVDGNITNMPMLASVSHIASDSPCIGGGSDVYSSGVDIDEEPWNNPPSMGCDEFNVSTVGPIDLQLLMPTRIAEGAAIPVQGFVFGAVSLSSVDFGDGITVSNQLQSFHTWATTGAYAVVLSAFNDDYPSGLSVTQYMDVVQSTRYVATVGSDTNDGLSWVTAKQTIQAAVDAATAYGSTVLITNGVYRPASEITVDNAMYIRSVNGAAVTIVDGAGSNRCFNLGVEDCILTGLTITNGYAAGMSGGGIYCENNVPIVSCCIIAGNAADVSGGGMYYGTADNSIFVGNSAANGGGMRLGVAYNSVFVDNVSAENGGGIHSGTVNNSIVWYNTAGGIGDNLYSLIENYVCSPDATQGINGSITNVPLFVDRENGDYHLLSTSPCIDAGDNALIIANVDFDGIPVPLDGKADGSAIVDMGCYEYINVLADSDNDGMTDGWEDLHFGNPIGADAEADQDSDWYDNYSEYVAGTDPTNDTSFLAVAYTISTNGFVINWDSVTSRTYSVLWTGDLMTNSFQSLATNIDYPRNSYTDTVHSVETTGFYRVDVKFNE